MGAFFGDLSHTSTTSVAATATTPSFFTNYEDVQDTNFNSWAKTDEYDNYDDGRSPLLVAKDGIMPKLLRAGTATANNTFLYDVTSSAGITLARLTVITTWLTTTSFIPCNCWNQRDGTEHAYAAGTTVQQDFPLYWFWGHQTTSLAGATTTLTQAADAGDVDTTRGAQVLKSLQLTLQAPKFTCIPQMLGIQIERNWGRLNKSSSPPPVHWLG